MSLQTVERFLGPLLVANLVNALVFGACIIQFWNYFHSGLKDHLMIRFLVVYELVMNTVHTGAQVYSIWDYCVNNFNNPASMSKSRWELIFSPAFTALIICPVQVFLAWRIKLFTRSNKTFGVLVFFSVAQIAFAVANSIHGVQIQSTVARYHSVRPLIVCWLSICVAVDLALCALLAYHLHRNRSGKRKTDSILRKIIKFTIETAVFATVFSLLDLALFLGLGATNYHSIFGLSTARVYTNALLLTLNTRISFRKEIFEDQASSTGRTDPFIFMSPDFLARTSQLPRRFQESTGPGEIQRQEADAQEVSLGLDGAHPTFESATVGEKGSLGSRIV